MTRVTKSGLMFNLIKLKALHNLRNQSLCFHFMDLGLNLMIAILQHLHPS